MLPKKKHKPPQQKIWLGLIIVAMLFFIACIFWFGSQLALPPFAVSTHIFGTDTIDYDCHRYPAAASEAEMFDHIQWIIPPPEVVQSNTVIKLHFRRGYGLYLLEIYQCRYAQHIIHTTPSDVRVRPVFVYLDDQLLTQVTCAEDCQFSVQIPADIAPGEYQLRLDSLHIGTQHKFPLRITTE